MAAVGAKWGRDAASPPSGDSARPWLVAGEPTLSKFDPWSRAVPTGEENEIRGGILEAKTPPSVFLE